MGKMICIFICITLFNTVCGQESILVADGTPGQGLSYEVCSQWDHMSAAISFAKIKGTTPNEFGKYTGNLFASVLNEEYGFSAFSQDIIHRWKNWRTNMDTEIFIIDQTEDSFACKVSLEGLKTYIGDQGKLGVSFDEMMQCITGIYEQIAASIGCAFHMEMEEEWTPCTATWYTTAIITVNH
jgi:hypothetical protein